MLLRRIIAVLTTTSLAGAAALAAAPAQAHEHRPGAGSLATVLAADGGGFDRTRGDFDILDNAVGALLLYHVVPGAVITNRQARKAAVRCSTRRWRGRPSGSAFATVVGSSSSTPTLTTPTRV